MWSTVHFMASLTLCMFLGMTYINSLSKFAVISELCWVLTYALISAISTLVDSISLISAPLIILVMASAEGVLIWLIILLLNYR